MNTKISEVDLFITEECNLNCKYCYAPKSDNKLTLEQGKKIIDKVKELCPDRLQLSFWGGEPMMYPELVADLAEYAKSLYAEKGQFETLLITNGTFYDNEIFKRLKRVGMRIQVSIDGMPEVNDEVRGQSDLVISNMKKILVNFPDMGVRMTFLPTNVHKLAQNIMFIRSLGVKKVMHQADIAAEWEDSRVEVYAQQLESLYKAWLENPKKIGVMFLDKNHGIFCGSQQDESYCGAGKSLIAILPNGDIYPCHRAASNRVFQLGNILEGTLVRGNLLTVSKNNENCGSCRAIRYCHTCLITHQMINGSMTDPIKQYCKLQFVEASLAEKYGVIRKQMKKDKIIDSMANVVADMAEQLIEIEKKLDILLKKDQQDVPKSEV